MVSQGSKDTTVPENLPPLARPLWPLVALVAGIRASIHAKLLLGFLVGAALLVGMGVLSLMVIDRMNQKVAEIALLEDKVDWSRRMEYQVTAQSHFRAMALLTKDDSNNGKIATAKQVFLEGLDRVEGISPPDASPFYRAVREANDRFAGSSARVLELYTAGRIDEALRLHLAEEHTISHVLEAQMRELQASALGEMAEARAAFEADRDLLTRAVVVFSVLSLTVALLLGFVLSWSVIWPIQHINHALARIASGEFGREVEVPNRDELGELSRNLTSTSQQLAGLYNELHALNENLQETVERQVQEIHERRLHEEIVHHELTRAWELQNKLLPKRLPEWPGRLEVAARFRPARETSGDFYDFFQLHETTDGGTPAVLQIAVGDVAGKGMGAALVMALARNTLRAAAQQFLSPANGSANRAQGKGEPASSPAATMKVASRLLHEDVGEQDFVACTLAVLEPSPGGTRVRLSNAAQVPPFLCRAGDVQELLEEGEHLPLGVLTEPDYRELAVDLQPGDILLFMSDGLPEAPALAVAVASAAGAGTSAPAASAVREGELFGFERVRESASRWSVHGRNAEEVADGIWNDVAAWCGDSSQHDDMTLLVLRIPGRAPEAQA